MKILIADDHALFRDNLAQYIGDIQPQAVVLQVFDFEQAFKLLKKEQNIDMIIVDLDATGVKAYDNLLKIKEISNDIQIIVISSSEDINQIQKILSENIRGYIQKSADFAVLKEAFIQIFNGQTYIPQALKNIENETYSKRTIKNLTNRQSQVLDLIAQGKSNKQIAYEMGVSEATVKLHINALLRSLKVNNRTQAVITAQKIGLI